MNPGAVKMSNKGNRIRPSTPLPAPVLTACKRRCSLFMIPVTSIGKWRSDEGAGTAPHRGEGKQRATNRPIGSPFSVRPVSLR